MADVKSAQRQSDTSGAAVELELNRTHLEIGAIARPHGVRGELKVRLHHEGSDALFSVTRLVLKAKGKAPQEFTVEAVRGNAKNPILALEGVDSCDLADALRGRVVWVERTQLEPLEDGEYYLVDLVGCQVVHLGQVIAKVTDVRPDPSVDTMILRMKDGRTAEVPIVDAWVGAVDLQEKTVQLLNEDGVIFE